MRKLEVLKILEMADDSNVAPDFRVPSTWR